MNQRDSVKTGNAGEHLVMAILLEREHHAAMADRGNPAFDILTVHGRKQSALRVKTGRNDTVMWSRKKDGRLFTDFDPKRRRDFVVLVLPADSMRNSEIYVVPTRIVDQTLRRSHAHWVRFLTLKGTPRKDTNQIILRFAGKNSTRDISRGFRDKWKKYREAWHLLEDGTRTAAS